MDRFRGALLGLALGDAMGAPFEGGVVERLLWRCIGRTEDGCRRYTDDTQMSLDLAASLVQHGRLDQDDVAARFAAGYRWSRGYGPGAARVLRRIRAGQPWREASRSVYPMGSFGNGAAMRAPVVGLFFHPRRAHVSAAARASAELTHAHPLALEGAELVAIATSAALHGASALEILEQAASVAQHDGFAQRVEQARAWLSGGTLPPPAQTRRQLGMGITAVESCVTALFVAAHFLDRPWLELHGYLARCGGDVDTVGAMASAIWGACRGYDALPAVELARLEGAPPPTSIVSSAMPRSRAAKRWVMSTDWMRW